MEPRQGLQHFRLGDIRTEFPRRYGRVWADGPATCQRRTEDETGAQWTRASV